MMLCCTLDSATQEILNVHIFIPPLKTSLRSAKEPPTSFKALAWLISEINNNNNEKENEIGNSNAIQKERKKHQRTGRCKQYVLLPL